MVFLDFGQTLILQNISNNSFSHVLAVEQFVKRLITRNLIHPNDIFKGITLMGTFANGYYQTFLNYSLTNSDVFYSFQKINPETFSRKYPFYFNPTAQSFGDSGDFQYLHFSNGNNLKLFYTINPNNTGKVRECIGERIGYYDNSKYIKNGYEQDLDFFPLDPALKTTYYMHSSNYNNQYEKSICFVAYLRRDYSPITNNFMNLSDETLISHIVEVCFQSHTVIQKGVFIEQMTYPTSSCYTPSSSDTYFKLYEKTNKNANEPYVFTFLTKAYHSCLRIDLFFFINRLFRIGKFRSNERIASISRCIRFFSGTGEYQFPGMLFPTKSNISFEKTMRCNDQVLGCLVCDSSTCILCDVIGNWVLVSGICRCNSDSNQIIEGNMTLCRLKSIPIFIKKNLACMFSQLNQTQNSCIASPLPAKAQAALVLSSTPNLGMMLKVSQVLCLVDDFMFYVYTNMTYGREFEKFLYFMWNISMERWVPSSFSSFYYDIQDKYDESVEMKNIRLLPKLWTELQEDTGFISNTRDYWIGSIPFTAVTFILMHLLFTLLRKHKISFSDNIVSFKWFTVLFVNLFLQNTQILAFRAFQQIFYGQSPNAQNFREMYFLNHIVCYMTFFFVVVSACAGQYIIRIFIAQNIKHIMDIVWYSNSTVWFMIVIQLTKITNGFLHASYELNNTIIFPLLLVTQGIIFVTIVSFKSYFRLKIMFSLMVTQFFLKIIIHISLVMRVVLKQNSYQLSLVEQNELGNLEITLIWIIFGVAACELLTMAIQVPKIPAHCRTDINKIISVSRRKRIVKLKSKMKVQIHKSVSNSKRHIQPSVDVEQKAVDMKRQKQRAITFKLNKKVLTQNTSKNQLFHKLTFFQTTIASDGPNDTQTIKLEAPKNINKIKRK